LFLAGSQESRVGCSLKTEYTLDSQLQAKKSRSISTREPSQSADGDVCVGGVVERHCALVRPILSRFAGVSEDV